MAITLKRQLDDSEKAEILRRHGRVCFATGHPVPEGESLHFDHIRAFTDDGPTELNNIAPMCELHNKAKGTLPLEDFRVKLRLEDFFSAGDSLTLRHILQYLRDHGDVDSFGERVILTESDGHVQIERGSGLRYSYPLHMCPTTQWRYFYAMLPIALLDSDDEEDHSMGLQPRFLIFDKVFALYRHFQRHPVLQPSICRVDQQRIALFDGQHKVAALLWTGRREFECKVYLSPDIRLLNQTNIAAHDKYAQTRFYSSIMVMKLGYEFGRDFERYRNEEDGAVKSELGFMRFLDRDPAQALTKADRNARFRSYLYNSVLSHQDNKLARLVSTGNRSTDEKPLTIDMLGKSIFSCFLCTEPLEDNMATTAYKRDREIENTIALMSDLYDLALCSWNPKAGPQDGNQLRLVRLFRSKSVMAWSVILKGAICGKLEIDDQDERARPLYRELSQAELDQVRRVVERLVNWSHWRSAPNSEIDRVLADNKSAVKEWFRTHGLTTGYLMGADE